MIKQKITNNDLKATVAAVQKNGKFKFPIYESDAFYIRSIDDLNITNTRANNAIKRNHIKTIADLVAMWDDLDHLRGLGAKSICDIKYALCEFQFGLIEDNKKKDYLQRIIDLN